MRTRLLGLLAVVLTLLLVAGWTWMRPEPPPDWGEVPALQVSPTTADAVPPRFRPFDTIAPH